MKQPLKKYDITQCTLYRCTNQRLLEKWLRLHKYDLNHIQKAIEYYSFERDKKDTTEKRKITAPAFTLKQVQARIHSLLQHVERPNWLISGEKGKSYIDNGKAHIQSNYVLALDIKKFYDCCRREYVFRFFTECLKTSRDVAGVLTDIVTYQGGIPTGCPTSQIIAYYAYRNMFEEISEISSTHGCKFTLYVDDMTFSSVDYFPHEKLANEVDIILRKYGHRPKYKKTKFYTSKESKPITGTIVAPNHLLDVPNSLQRKVYDNFQSIKHCCLQDANIICEDDENTILTLRGQLNAAHSITAANQNGATIFPEINRLAHQVSVSPTPRQKGRGKRRAGGMIKIPRVAKLQS